VTNEECLRSVLICGDLGNIHCLCRCLHQGEEEDHLLGGCRQVRRCIEWLLDGIGQITRADDGCNG
jgi:hypothetical protein